MAFRTAISFKAIPDIVKVWIAAHPYQTAIHVVNGAVLLNPAAPTVPILNALGFTAMGPSAGSVGSTIMSSFGSVPAGGIFATAQSAAMGGYGVPIVSGAAQAAAIASSAVIGWLGHNAAGS